MKIKYNLHGKVAVITGVARGLGLAFAKALTRAGCRIAGFDIETEAQLTTGRGNCNKGLIERHGISMGAVNEHRWAP